MGQKTAQNFALKLELEKLIPQFLENKQRVDVYRAAIVNMLLTIPFLNVGAVYRLVIFIRHIRKQFSYVQTFRAVSIFFFFSRVLLFFYLALPVRRQWRFPTAVRVTGSFHHHCTKRALMQKRRSPLAARRAIGAPRGFICVDQIQATRRRAEVT